MSAAEHVSNLDGTVPRTLARVWSPGFLAREYFAGRRGAYLRPVQLFLLASIVVFFVLPKTGMFRWGIEQYREAGQFGGLASRLADADISAASATREQYADRFDAALWNQKKTSLLLLVPLFALATMTLERLRGRRRVRRYYVEHLVHAIHFFAFWLFFLLVLIAALYLLWSTLGRWAPARPALSFVSREQGLTSSISAAIGTWLYRSHRLFFEQPRLVAVAATVATSVFFWWLFYDWYQTFSVLGTFLVWQP